jgi:hypothetical protein
MPVLLQALPGLRNSAAEGGLAEARRHLHGGVLQRRLAARRSSC